MEASVDFEEHLEELPLTNNLGWEAMTMVARDKGWHPWSMPQEWLDDTFRF